MRPGFNQKMENFCLAYIELGLAGQAYARAYPNKMQPKSQVEAATKLMAKPEIQARIAELRDDLAKQMVEKTGYDRIAASADLDEVIAAARANKTYPLLLKAFIAKQQLHGLLETKVNHTVSIRPEEARQVVASLLPKYAHLLPGQMTQ